MRTPPNAEQPDFSWLNPKNWKRANKPGDDPQALLKYVLEQVRTTYGALDANNPEPDYSRPDNEPFTSRLKPIRELSQYLNRFWEPIRRERARTRSVVDVDDRALGDVAEAIDEYCSREFDEVLQCLKESPDPIVSRLNEKYGEVQDPVISDLISGTIDIINRGNLIARQAHNEYRVWLGGQIEQLRQPPASGR